MARGVPHIQIPSNERSSHSFSRAPQATIERSVFDRSFEHKTTFDEGLLVPVLVDEVLPGDTFHVRMTALARLTTPIKALMDNMYLDSFFFFVPMRLVWANFVKFMGEQTNPGDSTAYTVPIFSTPFTPPVKSLADYMGVMTAGAGTVQSPNAVNCLPHRAFWLIYNQWFRDENLINSRNAVGGSGAVTTGDGPDAATDFIATPPRRGKRHDYFTSCLPWPQKGTASSVPITGSPVVKTNATDLFTGVQARAKHLLATTGGNPAQNLGVTVGAGNGFYVGTVANNAGVNTDTYPSNLYADLTAAGVGFTINAMRQAFQIQKLLERDARGGSRYIEIVKAHFGVTSPDARLQRAEYLGGGSTPITVSPVVQTAYTLDGTHTPQGNIAAAGTAIAHGHGFVKSFTEHGYLIGIVNVRAALTYSQGLRRMWSRQTRYDFYWPAFAHIGEQAVENMELYWDGTTANNAQDNAAFGYQERYAEYRHFPSMVTGLMRPQVAGTLAVWNLCQQFGSLPLLNQTFIEENAPMSRVVAVTTEPHFYFDALFSMKCARPMPVFGVPGFIDHF